MICPACKEVMIVVEYESIELDYCLNCHGVWFDEGELELLLDNIDLDRTGLSLGKLLAQPGAAVREKKRKCPICDRAMRKAFIGEEPRVMLDVCERGDGLWFDGGEVHDVVNQLATGKHGEGPSQKVLDFISQVLKADG